ncbi:MAG: hypothetical protein WC334_06515 [Kiritimatiellales bacterium]
MKSSTPKLKIILILGVLAILVFVVMNSGWGEFLAWQFDLVRGWKLEVPAEVPPYNVRLVQESGCDFYNSYFLIEREDGKTAFVLLDGDDSKWRNPKVVQKDGKTYFVRDSGEIRDRTPFLDTENNIVYSGYLQRTYKITELEFKNKQNQRLDFTVKPPVD